GRVAFGLFLSAATIGALVAGFAWVASGRLLTVASWTVLTLHAWIGLVLVPITIVHLLPRRWRVLRLPSRGQRAASATARGGGGGRGRDRRGAAAGGGGAGGRGAGVPRARRGRALPRGGLPPVPWPALAAGGRPPPPPPFFGRGAPADRPGNLAAPRPWRRG